MLKFGTIIRHGASFYVYLGAKGDDFTYYFALILSGQDMVKKLIAKKEQVKITRQKQSKENLLEMLTCFIILTTEDFDGHVATLATTTRSAVTPSELTRIVGDLNEGDLSALKDEIIENPRVLPPKLIREVEELFKS